MSVKYKTCKDFNINFCVNCLKGDLSYCAIVQIIEALSGVDNIKAALIEIISTPFRWDRYAIQQLPVYVQNLYEKLSILK